MSIFLREILHGRAATILAMGTKEDCQVLDFLQELAGKDANEAGKIWALLDHTKDHGPPRNEQKCRFFKKERIFEFKTTGGVRIMAFWDDNRVIICSHAFMKKSQKTPRIQITRSIECKESYFAAKAAGNLSFE